MQIVKVLDFPTAGIFIVKSGIKKAYSTIMLEETKKLQRKRINGFVEKWN